jgi:hypothetical protein
MQIISTKIEYDKIDAKEINRILIISSTTRIGNVLFLTPLIRALEKKLPHAQWIFCWGLILVNDRAKVNVNKSIMPIPE